MDKIDPLNQVAEFHKTFNHPIEQKPTVPAKERCELRVALLREELKELEQAIKDQDIVEVADALCDIQYVLSGAVLEFGLGEKFKALFEEVQRSNMSKSCQTEEEAQKTVAFYKNEKNTDCFYEASDDHFLVYRKSDHKTLKSINYSPANLNKIIGR